MRLLLLLCTLLFTVPAAAFNPATGDLSKDNPAYIRVMTYNVEKQLPDGDADRKAALIRVLKAVDPDVIAFQEIPFGATFQQLRTVLNDNLSGNWVVYLGQTDSFNHNALASRFPIDMVALDTNPPAPGNTRGVTMGRVKLPRATYSHDLYVMAVHLKCCSGSEEDARRQQHADAIAAWMREFKKPGAPIELPALTPFVIVGDTNFIPGGSQTPYQTLMNGTISDTVTYGPSAAPDWDGTSLTDAEPVDVFSLYNTNAYGTNTYSSSSQGSRLDRFIYSDSAAAMVQATILNSVRMTTSQRATAGVLTNDTRDGSDHLPAFVDFAIGGVPITEPLHKGIYITEFMADPLLVSDTNGEWIELYNPNAHPIDVTGWLLRDSSSNFHVLGEAAIQPRSHFVMARVSNSTTNGNVPADYAYGTSTTLANGTTGDSIELYRGGIKIDGVRFNNGPAGFAPSNLDWGANPITTGRSRAMTGDYRFGASNTFTTSTTFYNAQDRGTPGQWNDGATPLFSEMFMIY